MTVEEFLKQSTDALQSAGISSPRLDCLILLEDATDKDRSWLLAHPEHNLTKKQLDTLQAQITRRAKHEPLAYLCGKSMFYGREFFVTANTLQPRPETETMIEMLLKMTNEKWQMKNIIDVGTGSGCIAITAKLELPQAHVYATDISEDCLKIAQKNAKNLNADVHFFKGDLLDALPPSAFRPPPSKPVILANLPYVPARFTINAAAMFEPELAIFGGDDGLDYYRQLFKQLQKNAIDPAAIFTESLPTQHQDLEEIAASFGYKLLKTSDFIQKFGPQ